jgi:hypothetical protein
MKTQLLLKVVLVLPIILFADWVIMVLLGCASCLFGFGKNYFCGSYCLIGKGILLLSAVLFIYLLLPDIRKMLNHNKHAKAS